MKNSLLVPFQILGVYIFFQSVSSYTPSLVYLAVAEEKEFSKYFGSTMVYALSIAGVGLLLLFSSRFLKFIPLKKGGSKYLVYSISAALVTAVNMGGAMHDGHRILSVAIEGQGDINQNFLAVKYSLVSIFIMLLLYLAWKDLKDPYEVEEEISQVLTDQEDLS